jgi:hypothetical protein
MLLTIALAWSLTNCCPVVKHYRDEGYTDKQIEEGARAQGVPEWLIALAKRHCKQS